MNDRRAATWQPVAISGLTLVCLAGALAGAQSTRAARAGTVEHVKVQ